MKLSSYEAEKPDRWTINHFGSKDSYPVGISTQTIAILKILGKYAQPAEPELIAYLTDY